MKSIELQPHGTDEQADYSVTMALGHVAFMAGLIEVRDQRDARIMKEIVLHRRLGNSTHELCLDAPGMVS
jgi:hypothetical protein